VLDCTLVQVVRLCRAELRCTGLYVGAGGFSQINNDICSNNSVRPVGLEMYAAVQ
jgi:hypothetical protein